MNISLVILVLCASAVSQAALVENVSPVVFSLYRRNVTGQKVTNAQTLTGLSGQFRSGEKSYFVIHGWNDGGTDSVRGWELNLTGTLLAKDTGANVFVVDWQKWSNTGINYFKAKFKCEEVGKQVASFIKQLEVMKGASRRNMHLIGHSLGGQVAGFAGSQLRNPKLARITGLDTSGVAFNCLFNTNDCLDKSDAEFVDEIHTLVSALPKGHADFYPMPTKPFRVALETKITGAHYLAVDYFIKSIEAGPCAFKSRLCHNLLAFYKDNCAPGHENSLGFFATKPKYSTPNQYYLHIDINKPC